MPDNGLQFCTPLQARNIELELKKDAIYILKTVFKDFQR